MALIIVGFLVDFANKLFMDPQQYAHDSLPAVTFVLLCLLAFFIALYVTSRIGFVRIASCVLLAAFLGLGFFMAYTWGVDLPASILFYVLTIAMAGILLGTRASFITTGIITVLIAVVSLSEQGGLLTPDRSWANEGWAISDVIVACAILFIITLVTWLSNREISRSLRRAKDSEHALKLERDLLEERVAERTAELRAAELARLSQTYRFVEFGKIASGLFHDLVNPLTALSLNIENIADTQSADGTIAISALAEDVVLAKSATTHMQKLMDGLRRHLEHTERNEHFSLKSLLEDVLHTMRTYAHTRDVQLQFASETDGFLYGDPTACIQICTNLISNAIESFTVEGLSEHERSVTIMLESTESGLHLTVTDTGSGISEAQLPHIFEPFFSTKDKKGLGLGLPLTKDLVEKQFGGSIDVTSAVGEGTTFTVYFPIREP